MKHYPISKKEILSRINLTPISKLYYFYAWLCFFFLIIISCILVRVLDYLFKHQSIMDIWSDTGMYVQMITFLIAYTIFFLIQPKQLHHIFPFFIAKKLMNQPLIEDMTQAYYVVGTATLLKIENITDTHLTPVHQRLYLQLEQQSSTWFTLYSSLLWAMPQRNLEFYLTDECIGQKLNVCYLPQSQIILQLFAQQNLQQDLAHSRVLQHLYHPIPSEKLKHIPSEWQYALLNCQSIKIETISIHQKKFQLQITTTHQNNPVIQSTEPHFDLFYSVLQQRYKLPDLTQVQQQSSNTSSKIITLYDLPKQLRNIYWVLFSLLGLFLILALLQVLTKIFIILSCFIFIVTLAIKITIFQSRYLKILESN